MVEMRTTFKRQNLEGGGGGGCPIWGELDVVVLLRDTSNRKFLKVTLF